MNHRPLTPLQQAITFRLNGFGTLDAARLRDSLASQYRRLGQTELDWHGDFSLACDLLALYGMLRSDTDTAGARRLVSRQPRPLPAAPAALPALPRRSPRLTWPLTTATAGTLVAAGCSLLPIGSNAPGHIPTYADGSTPPSRIEQFYAGNNMVYRYCHGDECPAPTPKRPAIGGFAYANHGAARPAPLHQAAPAPGAAVAPSATPSTTDNSRHAAIAAALAKLKDPAGAPTTAPAASTESAVGLPSAARKAAQPERAAAPVQLAMADTASPATNTIVKQAVASAPSATDTTGRLKSDPEFTSYKGIAEFANGSQVLDGLNKQKIAELAPQARAAAQVRLRGRVARETLDEDMKKLAVGRAYAVKMEFARHDVPKDKIRILNPKAELVDAANPKASVNRSVDIFIDMPQQAEAGHAGTGTH